MDQTQVVPLCQWIDRTKNTVIENIKVVGLRDGCTKAEN
jgi:hypothetical protein